MIDKSLREQLARTWVALSTNPSSDLGAKGMV
jgi:hypothetical protein